MGNNPAGKKVNTPKGKYLGIYLFASIPRLLQGKYLFTFGIRFLLEPQSASFSDAFHVISALQMCCPLVKHFVLNMVSLYCKIVTKKYNSPLANCTHCYISFIILLLLFKLLCCSLRVSGQLFTVCIYFTRKNTIVNVRKSS